MDVSGLLLSFIFGFLPMLIFAYVVYWVDRYEKEPVALLGGVFLWGAIIAAGAAFVVNSFLGLGIYMFTGSQAFTELSTASVFAPIIEEVLKGLACFFVFLFFRREFDSVLDGIVYAAITAIGFAATENIYYIYTYGFQQNGIQGILYMFFVRVILVGWQHPFFTAFIGIGLAVSRLNKNRSIKVIAPIIGLAVAIMAHSFHNLISELVQGVQSVFYSIVFDWSGWIAMIVFVVWALYREQKWIIAQLPDEVANGIITPSQYKVACSAWSQTTSRINALFSGKYRLVDRFYLLTAELAFKKHQSSALGEVQENQPEIDRLRSELEQMSTQLSSG
ncbi:MAG: PrsW family intramembrane metalloprotease [Anaerolineales bacterium]|nr:MAG: PrsW family intramembrane metalloprotease [Anaerolineales bacterium]